MLLCLVTLSALLPLSGCSNNKQFKNWNECDALTTLKNYVKDVTNKKSKNYIPVEDRIATFDMDGTFIGELYATYFEYNLLEYRVLEDPTYKDKAPDDVKETANDIRNFVRNGVKLPSYDETHGFDLKHAHAAAKAYAGMTIKEFDKYVTDYAQRTPFGFEGMTYATSFYKPMLDVFDYLEDNNFTYYVVSGSDRYLCRALVRSLGIPSNRVIGMDVELRARNEGESDDSVNYDISKEDELVRSENLIIKNLKTNKVTAIAKEIGKVPVLSFGNSSGDVAMHNYCLGKESNIGQQKYRSEAFMLVADDDVRDHADLEEGARRQKKWEENKYNIISMKNDFKTIYGEGVKKVDFPWKLQ